MFQNKPIPFRPDCPINPENFEGRYELIKEHIRSLNQVLYGIPQHFFINANHGMGKSSFALFLKNYALKNLDMIAVHVYTASVNNVDTLIRLIIENLLSEINGCSWCEDFLSIFKDKIESTGDFELSFKFKDKNDSIISYIKNYFAYFLGEFTKIAEKNGIFIIIDDINGLSKTPDFANWYKSFTDSLVSLFHEGVPVAMMLLAHPDTLNALYNHNPSFNRIFTHREITPLTDSEVRDFFINSFDSVGMKLEKDALNLMVYFSSRHPTMMQEIGAGIYWTSKNDIISFEDAFKGIIRAGEEIGIKYLKSSLDSSIMSDKYLTIFNKIVNDFIVNFDGDYTFKKNDFSKNLDDGENKVLNNFLIKSRQLGILEFYGSKKDGHYKFRNNLFPLYFAVKSLKSLQN